MTRQVFDDKLLAVISGNSLGVLATIKRETGSWKQTAFATVYLFALAYAASFVTYQVAKAMGAG